MSLEPSFTVKLWRKLSNYLEKYLANEQKLISLGIVSKNKMFDRERAIEVLKGLGGLELP